MMTNKNTNPAENAMPSQPRKRFTITESHFLNRNILGRPRHLDMDVMDLDIFPEHRRLRHRDFAQEMIVSLIPNENDDIPATNADEFRLGAFTDFSIFLDPNRPSPPDIDTNFNDSRENGLSGFQAIDYLALANTSAGRVSYRSDNPAQSVEKDVTTPISNLLSWASGQRDQNADYAERKYSDGTYSLDLSTRVACFHMADAYSRFIERIYANMETGKPEEEIFNELRDYVQAELSSTDSPEPTAINTNLRSCYLKMLSQLG